MTFNRRDVLKATGVVTGGIALGSHTLPAASAVQDASTLTVWDTLNDPQRTAVMDTLGESFSSANGGVTVERESSTTDELTDRLKQVGGTPEGPHVAQVNNGEFLAGPMIRDKKLIDLAPYAEQYGWNERFAEGLLARNRFSPDGTVFGEGDLFGISAESEIVGFYYNRQIFSEAGVAVPTTFADFETLLASLREAGQEPLVFGSLDKYQLIHLFGEIQGTMTTREYLDNIIYRKNNASFEDPSMLGAANKLLEWNEAVYFMKGYEGVSADDAAALFNSGAGAILMSGSWSAAGVGEALGENAGFFLMPPLELGATPAATAATPVTGGTVIHVGGVGIPYSILANAPDPELAAAYLDHLVSEEALNLFIEAGSLPSGDIPADAIVADTLPGDLYAAWNGALAANAVGHYLDWASPDMSDVITGGLQELLGGQLSAEDFVGRLQDTYAASFA